jgi:Tfp pilus assembly protein PilZ
MGVANMTIALWGPVCGSMHAEPRDCPGDLRATGPERHGWRVAVDTPFGIEAYGVLVAPTHEKWRARILTFPNVLWTIPGGAATLKFVGTTAQAAEALAASFIEGHIKSRGFARRDAVDHTAAGRYRAEARPGAVVSTALRKPHVIPIRFGQGPALFSAMTGNLSESGLFVATMAPPDPGTALRLMMSLETGPLGMKGEVVWKRPTIVLGRPIGMGVRLFDPPSLYQEFVREIR